jgi:hypothetical protein
VTGSAPVARGEMLLAHGIGGRQDLPIPFEYALVGAAVTLVVSFVLLGILWSRPKLTGDEAGRPLPAGVARVIDSSGFRWAMRLLGLVAAGYVAVAALAGPDLATNPTAGVVYVFLWVGLVPLSLLFGPVWRLLNPLRTLHLLLSLVLRTRPEDGLRPVPAGLGYWPAAVGLLAFVWLELVAPDRATLPVLRTWFGLYAGIHLLAAAVYGSSWFDKGDAFEVWSKLFGRLSVFGRRSDGVLVVRSPLNGMAGLAAAPGLVTVVAVMLGSTAYDGISNAPQWVSRVQASGSPTLYGTAGLFAMVAFVLVTYTVATLLAGRLGHGRQRELPGEFAHSIVPIALGYVVAHYYSLFILEGQRTLIFLSDPLVRGSDLLGTRGWEISAALVTPTGVSTLQVVAVVVGHVLGVILAHDRAVRLFPRRQALAGQLPLLVLMVGYTLGGLLLLFAG